MARRPDGLWSIDGCPPNVVDDDPVDGISLGRSMNSLTWCPTDVEEFGER
jgi:hypothetical protein